MNNSNEATTMNTPKTIHISFPDREAGLYRKLISEHEKSSFSIAAICRNYISKGINDKVENKQLASV